VVVLLQPGDDPPLGTGDVQAVEELRVHVGTVSDVGALFDVTPRDHLDDREVEGLREVPVALVVAGAREHRAGAIGREHVVGDPNRYRFAVDRVEAVGAGEHAGLYVLERLADAVTLGAARGFGAVGVYRCPLRVGGDLLHQRVLRREHRVGTPEQGVGPGGEHVVEQRVAMPFGGVALGHVEAHPRALGATDPFPLLLLGAHRPLDILQAVEQPLGVLGDAQHPLAHHPLLHRVAGLDVLAVLDLLVGEDRSQGGTPVHRDVRLVGEALLVQLEEDPLGPPIVARIGGGQLAGPVVGQAQVLLLLLEHRDVPLGDLPRVLPFLHRLALGGQPEGVPPHDPEHVEAHHPLHPRHHVGGDVPLWVSYVEPGSARVGEHVQDVEFVAGPVGGRGKGVVVLPVPLPLGIDGPVVVAGHGLLARFVPDPYRGRRSMRIGASTGPRDEACRLGGKTSR
jgi:hypothetical protein